MSQMRFRGVFGTALILAATVWVFSPSAGSQVQYQFQVLHTFDGENAEGPVVFDQMGNLYGATQVGGAYGGGTVFELTPEASGVWTENILYNFPGNGPGGFQPDGVFVIDGAGNLYGTTTLGGNKSNCIDGHGCGTVFELSPAVDRTWTESTLYSFCSLPNCADGGFPGWLTLNPAGGLYGVTTIIPGTAFELMPGANGWTYTLLYGITAPVGNLALDAEGNLYGENGWLGGANGNGDVFALHPEPGGQWNEVVLFNVPSNGGFFGGGITLHEHGLYTTSPGLGGLDGCLYGCVFDLTRGSGPGPQLQVLYDFPEGGAQGAGPIGPVAFDGQGDLFGVTAGAGAAGTGVIYGMRPESNGSWEFKVLYKFAPGFGGSESGVTIDTKGNLYGVANDAVFELSPMEPGSK